ncbi:ankyrin repeat-containing domain protein [Rhexocercosporidium sp. MPI-PUGE-AT-0058]|nr:ankyrin repeat-containing domain protein [Rhexocercosporidium sp. MPI-PUGE-AT-0058]
MALSGPGPFEKILANFKKRLSPEDIELFQFTTLDDLKASIKRIQTEQAARKGLRNLNKIKPFLNGVKQYAGVLEVFVQAKPEILAFIWGPIKLCLQIASKLDEAFDALLDAYEKIGNCLPILSTVDALFSSHPHLKEILANILEDILDFHKRAIVFFKQRIWKLTFKLTCHTFSDMFGDILKKLDRSQDLMLQSASIAHFQESQDARTLFTQQMKVLLEAERDGRKKAVIDWLSSNSSSAIQHQELKEMRNMLPQTTRWIFSQPQMLSWLKRTEYTPCTFWLCGIPGAGKTVIFSSVVDEISATLPQTQAIYFYCKNNDPLRSHFSDIIKSLISQILHLNPNCLDFIYEAMLSYSDRRATDSSKLLQILEEMLSNHDSLYIGIDGLDECSEKERKLLSGLITVVSRANDAQGNIQLFVTSRQEKDLERSLKSAVKFNIQEKNLEADITAYVTCKTTQLCQMFPFTQEREQLIKKEICTRPKDMFLLARLIMDNLLSQDSLEDLNEELKFEVLPHGIDEAYGRMLIRIGKSCSSNPNQSEKRRQRAKLVLTLITTSHRALYEHEIQGALSINPEEKNVDFENRHIRFPLDDLCGPIIKVRQNGIVDLIHPTAKDYLWQYHSDHYIQASNAEVSIATLCTSYLTFDCFNPELAEDLFGARVKSGDFAFQEYAACNWFKHAKSIFNNADVENPVPEPLQTAILILQKRHKLQPASSSQFQSGQLRKADIGQLLSEVEQLYAQTGALSADGSGTQERIPYLLPQIYHCRSVIEDWAIKGTEQEKLDKFYGKTPFRCPVLLCPYFTTGFRNHKEREKHCDYHQRSVMCPHDACDYSVFGLPSDSALKTHLELCHEDPSQTSVFPQIKSRSLEQALEDAIAVNDIFAITALATELASLPDRKKGFVLQALTLGHREAAFILVNLLGTPSELDYAHKNSAAIFKVCETGDEDLFDILVEKGADINILPHVDSLTTAIRNRRLSIVRKLLDNPTYDKKNSHASYTKKGALAIASTGGFGEVLSLLLERDSEYFSTKSRYGSLDFRRALSAAIKESNVSCAKILLGWALEKCPQLLPSKVRKFSRENIDRMIDFLSSEEKKTITEGGGTKGNALQAMSHKGDCEAVSHLIDLGADVDNLSGDYGTPMMAAASTGKLEVISLLIERGADIMKKDDRTYGSGGSAIDAAAANCHEPVVQALLDKGAVFTHESRHSIGMWFKASPLAALSHKAKQAAPTLMRLLLDSGANANGEASGKSHKGERTPLQLAAMNGHYVNLQVLLEYGADVNHLDPDGYTPLQLAVQREDHSLPFISTLVSVKAIEINAKSENSSGTTALHEAAKFSKSDILEILLDHGAEIDTFNTEGETALVVGAASYYYWQYSIEKYQETLRVLVERGADIKAVDVHGNTVLMVVARHRKQPLETIQYLLGRQAEISTVNFEDCTTLMIAAGHGRDLVVKCLLQSRTSQYLEEVEEIWSSLESATRKGFVKTVRVLLEFSSKSIGSQFSYLLSAVLSVENAKKSPDIVTLLEEYGATFTPPAEETD